MAGHDIVVIGGSAGSATPLLAVLKQLPPDLPAALFVAYHIPPGVEGTLAKVLAGAGTLSCKTAEDGEPIRHGTVYVAKPDHHLLVKRGAVKLSRGPRENRWRPAIDTLFRSAAVAYGPRVIGIVLSGLLDDGTAGLQAIQKCGGTVLVQDPLDAEYPDMPQSVVDNLDPDHRLPVSRMGPVLLRLVREAAGSAPPVPPALAAEARVAESGTAVEAGRPSGQIGYICPDCGGPLQEQQGPFKADEYERYRCLVGHAWSSQSLLSTTDEGIESALWAAIRLFRQRANLLTSMFQRQREAGRERSAQHYEEVVAESLAHAKRLQDLAMGPLKSPGPGAEAAAPNGKVAEKERS